MLSKNILAVAAAIAPAFAQEEDTPDLTALVGSDDRLSTLGMILEQYPDVASTLADASNVTVLAPSNDAFESYLEEAGVELSDLSEDMVASLLNYHVLSGTLMAANFTESPTFAPTLLEDEMYTTVSGGQVVEGRVEDDEVVITSGLKSDATVIEPDLMFTGGVAHIIDAVNIIPENITATASAANLTAFLGALEAANLTDTIAMLEEVTIFAPSNTAFENIGSELGNISSSALASILQYHVINGTIAYSSTIGNGTVSTLGGDVNLTVADSAIFVNQARVVNADALVSSGVIHVIDSVLNPNGTNQMANPSGDTENDFEGAGPGLIPVEILSAVPPPTTTVSELVTTTDEVAAGYTTVTEGAVGNDAGGAGATESSTEGAAMVTGAVGMAALFGGAAFVANI